MAEAENRRLAEEEEVEEEEDDGIDVLEEDASCVMVQVANEHDVIKGLYRKYRAPGATDAERGRLVREIAGALSAHIYAEEEVLCPAFASEIGEGVRDHALDLDSSLKLLLADLKGMEVGQSGFGAKLEQLMEVFYQHLSHEEHHMKPLREAVGDERLLEMGGRFKAAKDDILSRSLPAPPALA